MSLDMSYFRAVQGATGLDNIKDVIAEETKTRLKNDFLSSISCEHHTKRNGTEQKFVVTKTDRASVMDIHAFPDEDLVIGDYIDCYGQKWIVHEASATNTFHLSGKMKQCNFLLRFQNGTSEIHERWCNLDKGVYSTAEKNTPVASTPDKQYVIWIPLDSQTEKIYQGKRLAIQKWYDKDGEEHVQAYEVTSVNGASENYAGGKLLLLTLRSVADSVADSLEEMVCDYIAPVVVPDPGDGDGGGGSNPGGWW